MNDNITQSLEGGESGEEGIRPEFLKGGKGSAVLGAAEQAAGAVIAAKTGGAGAAGAKGVSGAKNAGGAKAGESAKANAAAELGASKTKIGESTKKGFYTGANEKETGQTSKNDTEVKLNLPRGLKAAAPFMILLLAVAGIIVLIIGLPIMMIGALDYNLQAVLGFTETIGILEKQGEYVTAEMAANGEIPSVYASSLASNGVLVGQVGADGNFYQTNTYIADISEKEGLVAAASGFSYVSDEEGELALLYDGEIIRADDFVAKVESDPKLYAAYSGAADISTKYYYGDDVEDVYRSMGLSRGNFNEWETTGDYAADEARFTEILNKVLNNKADSTIGGYHDDEEAPKDGRRVFEVADLNDGSGTWSKDITGVSAEEIGDNAAEKTKEYVEKWDWVVDGCEIKVGNTITRFSCLKPIYSDNATKRAAELLNTAVSSAEPYLAANAFIAIEEPIQRARVDGDGPVNEVMNTLTKSTSVSYQNVETGEMETKDLSILETENFRAVVSDSKYSLTEAANFGRDRVLKVTGQADEEIIKMTTVGAGSGRETSSVSRNGKHGDGANQDIINKANQDTDLAISKDSSETFQSVIGGNRIIEGGSFLNNSINSRVIGAMPSDATAIAAYHEVVEETLARKAEAERATLSPFDISSPNTFLGSIVHNFATVALGSVNGGAISLANTASEVAGKAVANLTGSATAEGQDQNYTTMLGINCATVETVRVGGDLYCTSHNTSYTEKMSNTREDWKNTTYVNGEGETKTIGESLDDENHIIMDSDLGQFVTLGMDRATTVGVKSAEACEAHKNLHKNFMNSVKSILKDMLGMYEICDDVEDKYATGAAYTFGAAGDESTKDFSGYMLYDKVYTLLSGEESSVAEYRSRYYAKYPRDDSMAGIIARQSGMSKAEAEIALSYADYLNVIANYDASDRYLFGAMDLDFDFGKSILEVHNNQTSEWLYAWHAKETEYEDLRGRQAMTA